MKFLWLLLIELLFTLPLSAMQGEERAQGFQAPDEIQEVQDQEQPAEVYGMLRIEVESECSICTESFNAEELIVKTPCNHIFHQHCLLQWMEENPVCPFCRMALNEEGLEIIPFERFQQAEGEGNGYILEIPVADPHVVAHAPVHAVADVPYAARIYEVRRNLIARTQRGLGYGFMAAAGCYLADHYLLRRLPNSVRNLIHQGAGSSIVYYLLHRSVLRRLPEWGQQLSRGILGVAGSWFLSQRHDLPHDVRQVGLSALATGGIHQIFQSVANLDERFLAGQGRLTLALGASCFPIAAGLGLNGNTSLSPLVRQMSLIGGVGLGAVDAMHLIPVPERRVLQSALAVGIGEALSRIDLPAPIRHISRFTSGVGGAYLPNMVFDAINRRYGYQDMWRPIHSFMAATILGRFHRESELSLLGNGFSFYRLGWDHLGVGVAGFALGRGARFFFDGGGQALADLGERFLGSSSDSEGRISRISRLIFASLMAAINIVR
jgi:hypothetical protein